MQKDSVAIMNASWLIKRSFSYPIYYLHKTGNVFRSNTKVLMLMYHKILRNNSGNMLLQDGMYVNPETFEKQIKYLKSNFNIVPLNASVDFINNYIKYTGGMQMCSITFDDGWKDFYDNAYDIIRYHKVYATVFLPTDFIGTNNQLWTDKLGMLMSNIIPGNMSTDINGYSEESCNEIETIKGNNKERYEKAIEMLKKKSSEEIDTTIYNLAIKWQVNLNSQQRSFLSWNEIKEMFESGFINFGSHTKSHTLLTALSDQVIQDELIQSRDKLLNEGIVSKSFIPFAYPNGDHNDRIAKMVKSAGYSCALTTEKGWNCLMEKNIDVYKLKRVGVHQDMTSTDAMFACRIHGIY